MFGNDESSGQEPPVRQLAQRAVYTNPFVTVFDDDVVFRGGGHGRYLRIVEKDGQPGVAVLAECAGRFALVHVYRYAVGAWEWGVVRGFAHGDDPLASARAELREELGAEPATIDPMGVMTANSGLLAGTVHLFHATYDTAVVDPEDTAEIDDVRWVGIPDLLAEVAGGAILDGFTLAVITAATARGRLRPSC